MACLISTFQNVQSIHQIHYKSGAVLIICSFYLQGSGEIISPEIHEEQLKQIYERNKVKKWIIILLINSAYVRVWLAWGNVNWVRMNILLKFQYTRRRNMRHKRNTGRGRNWWHNRNSRRRGNMKRMKKDRRVDPLNSWKYRRDDI